jgi:hypothetical protein
MRKATHYKCKRHVSPEARPARRSEFPTQAIDVNGPFRKSDCIADGRSGNWASCESWTPPPPPSCFESQTRIVLWGHQNLNNRLFVKWIKKITMCCVCCAWERLFIIFCIFATPDPLNIVHVITAWSYPRKLTPSRRCVNTRLFQNHNDTMRSTRDPWEIHMRSTRDPREIHERSTMNWNIVK